MSDRRRSQRGSFYGDKRPEGYEPRHRRGRGGDQYAERRGGSGEGGYGGGASAPGTKPVEVGKEYKVRVIDRSERGEGVARVEGFIVFIKGAKPGEELTIKITNVGARAATAEVVQQPSSPAGATTSSPPTASTSSSSS